MTRPPPISPLFPYPPLSRSAPLPPPQAAHPETREPRRHLAEVLHQAGASGGGVDEQEAVPALEPHAVQTVLGPVEVAGVLHVGGDAQPAVEPVRPGVVGAEEVLQTGAGGLRDQARAAVPADVVEGVDPAIRVPHDDDALAAHRARQEVARLLDVLLAPD